MVKKEMPSLSSDEDAEEFVENADLSEYDLSDFAVCQFEVESSDFSEE